MKINTIRERVIIVCASFALTIACTITASAQCGGSFVSLAQAAAAAQHLPLSSLGTQSKSSSIVEVMDDDDEDGASIVGLWHIKFMVGTDVIQEAFQSWNQGGTEAHNPKVDPRGGSICLGAWKRTRTGYKLTHRVWNYGTDGTFNGTINLSETVNVSSNGSAHSGTFKLDFYDPNGMFMFEVPGNVVAERVPFN